MLLQPQRRGDGVNDGRTVIERREFAEACAVLELLLESTGDLEGQPGLTDAADAGYVTRGPSPSALATVADVVLASDDKLVARRGTPVRGRG